MKREIRKKINSISAEANSAAAEEAAVGIIEDLEHGYDERVQAGMSELDAYRDVLKNVDAIKELLESMPRTEDEERGRKHKNDRAYNEKVIDKICSALWLLVVVVYLGFSITHGGWHLTWLIFLWGAIGQSIMNMVKKYNRGTPLKKVLRKGISAILWLSIVIIYFGFSIVFGQWAISWIIFIVGALIEKVIDIFYN